MITGRTRLDVAINTGFAVVRLGSLLWVIRLASAVFAPETLGIFLLARRLASTVANLLQMGSSQTLQRFLPMTDSATARRRYVAMACLLWVAVATVALGALLPIRSLIGAWAFPSSAEAPELALWASALTAVSVLGFIAYSTFLAERRLVLANAIELMSVSGFLLFGLAWSSNELTPTALLRLQALGVVVLSAVMIAAYLFLGRRSTDGPPPAWGEAARAFVAYGLLRGGITALDMAVLTIGSWLLRERPAEAGYLIVAITVVQAIHVGLGPITQIAAIVAAQLVGHREMARLSEEVRLLLAGTLYATVLALAVLVPWSGYMFHLWLRDPELVTGVSFYFSWLAWGMLPLALFQALRGVIEMRWFAPRNLYTLLAAAAVHLLVYSLGRGLLGEAAAVRTALLATFLTMGVLTLAWLDASWRRPLRYWGIGRLASVGAVVALVNGLLAERPGPLEALLGAILTATFAVAGLGCWAPPPAVREVREFLWPRRDLESYREA